jgi:type II secretory pathway pseudopilin PulG
MTRREAGMTLVELVFGAAAALLVFAALGAALFGAASASRAANAELLAAREAEEALDRAGRDLLRSSLAKLSIDSSDPASDRIVFAVALPQADGTVLWGAEELAGQSYELSVASGRFVRRTLAADKSILREVVFASDLDRTGTVKPFRAERAGNTVRLTLRVSLPAGREEIVRELTAAFAPRN